MHSAFETWRPPGPGRFDLVLAATAWHWLDPATRYPLAWNQLRFGGHLAFWSAQHVFPIGGDPFFTDIQDVYDALGEGRNVGERQRRPGELPESVAEIVNTGLFENVMVRHFDWEVTYTAEQYLGLLDTFSSHIAMAAAHRDRLYSEIRRRLADRPDRRLRRHWGAVLHVAQRIDAPGGRPRTP